MEWLKSKITIILTSAILAETPPESIMTPRGRLLGE
jgi:hypothetical protein